MTDQDLIIGLGRATVFLLSELLEQNAINRERAIRNFSNYCESQGHEKHEQATKFFLEQMIALMKSDPSRPPPAPVIPFHGGK